MQDQTNVRIDWRLDRTAFDLHLRGQDGGLSEVSSLPASRHSQLLRALETATFITGRGDGPRWTKIILDCLAEPHDDWRAEDLLRRDAEAAAN